MRAFDSSRIPFPKGYEDFKVPTGFEAYVLEIGAGVGWHAVMWAKNHPQDCIVAVEHSRERFAKLEGRSENMAAKSDEPAPNLFPIHADAESFVVHCLPRETLDRVFLLYPNPYPKQSQSNKRWHNMPFMSELLSRLKTDGLIEMATNEDFYAAEYFDQMLGEWKLELVSEERVSKDADPDFLPRTHFEKKYYERGEMLHLFVFRKVS